MKDTVSNLILKPRLWRQQCWGPHQEPHTTAEAGSVCSPHPTYTELWALRLLVTFELDHEALGRSLGPDLSGMFCHSSNICLAAFLECLL